MTPPTLKTQNYTLRPFTREDALLWQIWDIDPEIQAHMPEPKNEPQDISAQYEYIKECEEDEEGYYWSIETNNTISPITIGTVSLFEINTHHKSAELGIVIGDKNFWGKSVASEVLSELTMYAFNIVGLKYIGAHVEEANIPMQRALLKVGFEQDGFFKDQRVKDGKRVNVVHFGERGKK
jgi:RimJ/RimL family protein N-acetyltransferase